MGSFKDSENHRLGKWWPALEKWPLTKTSDDTDHYNCYAYVAGDTKRPWAPFSILPRGIYWPVAVGAEEEDTIWPVLRAYETLGYEWCENGGVEAGVEKIAIYVVGEGPEEEPTHVAVQRENGVWQSKLGSEIDAEHALESLESSAEFGQTGYGKAKYFMSRKRAAISPAM